MQGGGQRMPDKDNFNAVTNRSTVRRLTPLECERLQGFPDGWTDIGAWTDTKGKVHKEADSPRYKALGNSIALPFWKVLAKRISAQYDRDITLGSLFDGIGGFPRVFEQINGAGTARWASEIEEFPIAVTKKHFPAMLHLGDITSIDWSAVEPVDVVTGGSPCQDLSVAGKRAGLAGERSGLYIEQIRCIKELRKADEQRGRSGAEIRPRFMVWENVPGAFSSNKGRDFAAVLEEAVRIIEPEAPPVSVPNKGWPHAGCFYDEMGRWSIAWRVHDAQFWGVPQRRKRISLICDFGGLAAPEVQFERKGLRRYSEQSRTERKAVTPGAEGSSDSAIALQGNGIDRADTAGCNGAGWRRGGLIPSTPLTDTPSVISHREKAKALLKLLE